MCMGSETHVSAGEGRGAGTIWGSQASGKGPESEVPGHTQLVGGKHGQEAEATEPAHH